jgi:CDP-diacylglycerol--glycerol-3-phosphate 3-phosphatidyltransferase
VGSMLLLASRIYNHKRGFDSNAATFGRPERLALLVTGLLAPAPYNTALFITAGFLCLVSSTQALASGYVRNKAHAGLTAGKQAMLK